MNIVNVVNFIRSEEEYRVKKEDLVEVVKKQMEIAEKYKFPVTFLFQHDALTKKEWVNLVKPYEYIEIGLWLELNRSLIERAGCEWKGDKNRTWEYYSHIDLTCGYKPDERIRIIDIAMNDFKDVFGYYPKTVGSWIIDSVSLAHLEKYGVEASLNCKDQWLTDGYSLWGGYYNQAYYPCRNNMFSPAQSPKEQINIPVFRMLGSDPIRQYDFGLIGSNNGQGVVTLECYLPPTTNSSLGGSNKEWVKWFFEQMKKYPSLSFGYAQAGQENAFNWAGQGEGYTMQMNYLNELNKNGTIKLLKVSDAGKWFKKQYNETPVSTIEAETDDKEHGFWYCSKYYRTFIYTDKNIARIKDITIFDDNYKERYLNDNCKGSDCFYDNLPLVDSFRWGNQEDGFPSGLAFFKNNNLLNGVSTIESKKIDEKTVNLTITINNEKVLLTLYEDSITINGSDLKWLFGNNTKSKITFNQDDILLEYNNFRRRIPYEGIYDSNNNKLTRKSNCIKIFFNK